MPYATVQDMIARFGEAELLRVTTPEDQPLDTINVDRVTQALTDASSLVDSYLRRKYVTPVAAPTPEIVRATCVLARYDLAFGSQTAPDEQKRLARKEVVEWLEAIGSGRVTLDGAIAFNPDASFARVQDRRRRRSAY